MAVSERIAERNRDLRARYQELVPKSEQIDGLTSLHTYRMRDLWGRPLEIKSLLIAAITGFLLFSLLNSFLQPTLGAYGTLAAVGLGFGGGWMFSGRFLMGDGIKVKHPHQRKEQRMLVANTVVGGPVVRPEDRYQFILGGEEASLEAYLRKEAK